MFEKPLETVKKYNLIKKGDKIVVGVSGGADSVCLLYFLNHISSLYKLKLFVIHINHGLRGKEADDDENYVKEICQKINVDFFSFHISLCDEAKNRKMTEEEAGRSVRYEIFDKMIKEFNADKIAVAHTMNDNAETMLINLCRGTGINGLSGISAIRDKIIRPFIECSRDDIENWLENLKVGYRTDSTNKSLKYTRNKVRLQLIPWLKENMNSGIVKILSKNASVISQENEYLERVSQTAFEDCLVQDEDINLNLDKLKSLDNVILRRVLRIACRKYNKELHDISSEHIEKIMQLINMQSGKKIDLPNNLFVQKTTDAIIISKYEKRNKGFEYLVDLQRALFIEETSQFVTFSENITKKLKNCNNIYTILLDYDKIKDNLSKDFAIRTRKTGDVIYLKGINGFKRIKTLFIDLKIPSNKRDKIPLLVCGQEVIAILGVRGSDNYIADESCKNKLYLQLWEIMEEN